MSSLEAADQLFGSSIFWAAHMWNITRGPLSTIDHEEIDKILGFSEDEIQMYSTRFLCDEHLAPRFTITTAKSYSLVVEHTNLEDSHALSYTLGRVDSDQSIFLGLCGPDWRLPVFRWTEAKSISIAATNYSPAIVSLLLLPSVWFDQSEDMSEPYRWYFNTLVELQIADAISARRLCDLLLSANTTSVNWQLIDPYGWVNNCDNSSRNSLALGCLDLISFRELAEFLKSVAR